MTGTKKVTRVYFREAAYVGATAVECVPPVEVRSSPRALEWSATETATGDVIVKHRTFVRGGPNGSLLHVDCVSRVPAANVRSVSYEDEPVVTAAVETAAVQAKAK